MTLCLSMALGTPPTARGADPPVIDTFSREVGSGLGTSEIGDLPWSTAGIVPSSVADGEARWESSDAYTQDGYGDSISTLDLGVELTSLPFEVSFVLRVEKAPDTPFELAVALTKPDVPRARASVSLSEGSWFEGPTDTLRIGASDSRHHNGDVDPPGVSGYSDGAPIAVRMRVDADGTRAKAWLASDAEPSEWQASDVGAEQTPAYSALQLEAFAFSGAATAFVHLDDLEIVQGYGQALGPLVLFVHGYGGDFTEPGFGALLDNITAERLGVFEHYQDRGYQEEDGSCKSQPSAILPSEPNGNMPIDADTIDPDLCDGYGDIGLNAVLLHADVVERYAQTGRKVILVANSGGAAIARGMLSYSEELGDGVATEMVDSVLFLQGAHDGSVWGLVAPHLPTLIADSRFMGLDRPAGRDLTPQSPWYNWANPGEDRLPDLPYFNVYSDMRVVHIHCALIIDCAVAGSTQFGDLIMLPGTDDPHDTPLEGGARFLDGEPGPQNWQWALEHFAPYVTADLLLTPVPRVVTEASLVLRPEFHVRFGDEMNNIEIPDCATGELAEAGTVLMRIIDGRLAGDPHECDGGGGG